MRLVLLLACLLLLTTTPAYGQKPIEDGRKCLPREQMLSFLSHQYQEDAQAMGVVNDNALVELFVSKDGKTFSVVVTMTNKWSCLVVTGSHWRYKKNPFTDET